MSNKIDPEKCTNWRSDVLEKCKNVIFDALTKNCNVFTLSDPLLADNMCQLHSVIILHTLLKCYNKSKFCYDVKYLQDKDIEILTYSAMLTLLKVVQFDKFDFIINLVLSQNFGAKFVGKKKERNFIDIIKERLNRLSVATIGSLVTKDLKSIFNECSAFLPHSTTIFKLLPCYATMYSLIMYLKENNLPLIVVLRRIERKSHDSGLKYRNNSNEFLFCKFEGGKFRLQENLNEFDKFQPAIVMTSFSAIDFDSSDYVMKFGRYIDGSEFPSKSYLIECDIGHLILMAAACDDQLSNSDKLILPEAYNNGDKYVKDIFKDLSTESTDQNYSVDSTFDWKVTNIYEKFIAHLRLAQECNPNEGMFLEFNNEKIKRASTNVFFTIQHVYVSNYMQVCYELQSIANKVAGLELDQVEICENINKKIGTSRLLKKLDIIV